MQVWFWCGTTGRKQGIVLLIQVRYLRSNGQENGKKVLLVVLGRIHF